MYIDLTFLVALQLASVGSLRLADRWKGWNWIALWLFMVQLYILLNGGFDIIQTPTSFQIKTQ